MDLKLGGPVAFWVLRLLLGSHAKLKAHGSASEEVGTGASKLEHFWGADSVTRFKGARVLDFGCGKGREAVAVALAGAEEVYGIDIRENCLQAARHLAAASGVTEKCVFLNGIMEEKAIRREIVDMDYAYSLDSFEHFAYPEEVLAQIRDHLRPGGRLLVSFGPPWKHPRGCHMMFLRPVPWMHLIFKEETIMAVRSLYKTDGAKRFEEVEGGLNKMTVGRFLRLVEASGFEVEDLHLIPIKGIKWFVNMKILREYMTSVVQCVLVKPAKAHS
jgi:2-polyprenyl-3-methyl-5-hydroxy-6-metoxy-1,4-benzoquinol methylase